MAFLHGRGAASLQGHGDVQPANPGSSWRAALPLPAQPAMGAALRHGCCTLPWVLRAGSGAVLRFGCCAPVWVLHSGFGCHSPYRPLPALFQRWLGILRGDGNKRLLKELQNKVFLEQNTSIVAQSQGGYCRISPALPRSEGL